MRLPWAPKGLRLAPESDSGLSNADGITNSNSLFMVGTAEAGATVKLFNDDRTLLGQGQADATGNWRVGITPALTDNTYRLTATATNLIGKSAASEGFNLTIDRTNPIVTLATPLGGSTITPNTRLNGTVNGTGSAGATLTYRFGTGTTTALQTPANGLFNSVLTLTSGLSGPQALVLSATDVAGNQSAPLNYSVTVNSTNTTPDVPVVVADLTQDTGVSRTDRLTTDASISGVVSARNRIVGLQGALVVPSVLVAGGVADPVGSKPFQDITATIDSAGNFTLSQAQLVDLYGSDLADGTYALKLRAVDELGNFSPEMRVTFTFDLTAPTQDITSLIDGITWIDGEVLAGSVSDGTGTGVNQTAYRFWQTGSSGAGSGDQMVTVSQTGTFNQTLGEIKNLAAGVYDFSVTSSDLAGNQRSQTFRFLKSDDRPIVDQDTYVLGSGEVRGQDLNTSASVAARPTGNWGYFGPTTSGGYGWGTYSTDSGSNSAPSWHSTSSPDSPAYIGTGYDLEYIDAVKKIVDYGTGAISQHPLTVNKKAALQTRQEVLNAIADRLNVLSRRDGMPLNDKTFFDQMKGVMQDIFATAYNSLDVAEKSPLNGLIERSAGSAGFVLAQDLVKGSTAVSVQVFQATLLAAFNEVLYGNPISATPEAHSALLKAALELGQTYAKLAPSRETGTVLASDADFGFLDMLWRAQQPGGAGNLSVKEQLDQGVKALGRLLSGVSGVSDPINTLKFLNNLLNAAANSVSLNEVRIASNGGVLDLRGDAHSAGFIRELIKLGFEVAKVNPTVTTTGGAVISEFLNTLLRGGDERQAQGGLNQFFEGLNGTSDRIKLLGFGDRLLQATQALQSPIRDARILSELLQLGGAYAGLEPTKNGQLNFFLDDIWKMTSSSSTSSLEEFLQPLDTTSINKALEFSSKLLKALKSVPAAQPFIKDPAFLKQYVYLARDYVRLKPDVSALNETKNSLDLLYAAKNPQDIAVAAQKLQQETLQFLESSSIGGSEDSALSNRPFIATDDESLNLKRILTSGISRYNIPEYSVYNVVRYDQNPSQEVVIVNANDGSEYGSLAYNRIYSIGTQLSYTLSSGYTHSHVYLFRNGELYYYIEGTPLTIQPGDKLLVENRFAVQPDKGAQLSTTDQAQIKSGLEHISQFYEPLGRFVAGAVYQWAYDLGESGRGILSLMPDWRKLDLSVEADLPKDPAFVAGRLLGDGVGAITGLLGVVSGGSAVAGGGLLCIAGIGCLAGAPAVAAGAALFVAGAVTLKEALENALQNASVLLSSGLNVFYGKDSSGAGSGSPLTPSRKSIQNLVKNNIGTKVDEAYAIEDVSRRASTKMGKKTGTVIGEDPIRSFLGVEKDPITNKTPRMPEAIIEKRNGTFTAVEVKNMKEPIIGEVIDKFSKVTDLMKKNRSKIVSEHILYLNKDKFARFDDALYSVGKGNLLHYNGKLYQLPSGQSIQIKFTDFVGR